MVTYQIQDNEEEFDVWKRMLDGFVETAKKQKMSFSVQKTVERDMNNQHDFIFITEYRPQFRCSAAKCKYC